MNETSIACVYNEGLHISKRFPFIGATFDLLTIHGIPVEIKLLVSRKPEQYPYMPPMYWVQCQVQMEVADSDMCYYVEFKEATETEPEYFCISTIRRDKEWFDNVAPRLKEFWDQVTELRQSLGFK